MSATAQPSGGATGGNAEYARQQRFPQWAFSTVQRLRKAVGIGAVIAAAVSIGGLEPQKWLNRAGDLVHLLDIHRIERAILALIQAAACLFLACLTPKPSAEKLAAKAGASRFDIDAAQESCKRIQLFVVATYGAWAVYYLASGILLASDPATHPLFDRAVDATLNTLPSLLLFWLYLELSELTIDPTARRMALPGNAAFHRMLSVIFLVMVIAPIWVAFGKGNGDFLTICEIASGCLNGVALALVVGCLGNKLIDPGPITLVLLYFYAIIQPMAATFHQNPLVHLLATSVALPLKVLLWLVLVWAFTTGVLSEYVYDLRILITRQQQLDGSLGGQ